MKFQIKVYRKLTIVIPDENIEGLLRGLCDRWGEEYDESREWDDYDILVQAEHDGLIDLPEEDWEVD